MARISVNKSSEIYSQYTLFQFSLIRKLYYLHALTLSSFREGQYDKVAEQTIYWLKKLLLCLIMIYNLSFTSFIFALLHHICK